MTISGTPSKSPRLILLIEDNEDDILLAQMAFSGLELPDSPVLLIIKDGKEALDYLLDEKNITPALTLIDLKLPVIDGVTVVEKISHSDRLQKMPLVVLTTSLEPKDIERCYKAGANSYLRKPVDFDEFKILLHKTVEYWLDLNIPSIK